VEITREYRNKFLSLEQLRGYYIIAEKIVQRIENNSTVKKIVKHFLVDNLIKYGRYALGKTEFKPGFVSSIITRSFLSIYRKTGETRREFVRANGKVV
jgi:hypothetical protein